MRPNELSRQLTRSPAVCGWLSSDSPYCAEVLSHSGYDAVVVDLQHGMFGLDRAVTLLQAVSSGPAVPLARSPSHDPATIGKLLDAGAYGIICPAVDSADEAAAFVRACRYPPAGERSYGPARALLYGGADYPLHADATVQTWAMIESAAALAALDDILATPGLDGVFVGPNDLALSLGVAVNVPPDPAVRDALRRVAAAARAHDRWAGVFCPDADVARELASEGFHLLVPGNDMGILRAAVAERVATVRGAAPPASAGSGY